MSERSMVWMEKMKSHSVVYDTQGDNSYMITEACLQQYFTLMRVLKDVALADTKH